MKKGFSASSGKKSLHQGPIIKRGSGVGHSSIPRTGYHPGGHTSARRIDKSMDSHSVDKKG